jgi:uncharacterized RDD family membrane protein YckC
MPENQLNCPNCQRSNPLSAKFCYNCGAVLPTPPPAPQPEPASPSIPAATPDSEPPQNYSPPASFNQPSWTNTPQAYGYQALVPPVEVVHPLLKGASGLPNEIYQNPIEFYSYVNSIGQVVVLRKASVAKRLGAGILDWIIASIPTLILTFIYLNYTVEGQRFLNNFSFRDNPFRFSEVPWWSTFFGTLIYYLYFFLTSLPGGQTPGKRWLNTRVVRFDGKKADTFTLFLRYILGYNLSGAIFFFGYLFITFDTKRQGWHDKLARTNVVETREFIEGRDFHFSSPTTLT